ncbi:MAG: DeoR/GlpR family DNA-binding transcription regulator [Clostridia bacterium]|nr:DeoR/GlpR family DNA-binding transcription regulator [Clostridia bacterium]
MFAAERIEKIKELLYLYKHVDVTSLSSILSVSEATVRRDLEKLEKEGFLKRTHGGALLKEDVNADPHIISNSVPNYEEKKLIGYIASQLVEDNEVIAIGSGTTCLELAKNLKTKKHLSIVTNNVLIAAELSQNKNVKVILTGGHAIADETSITLIGEFAYNMISNIYVNKVFLGVDGADINNGYTCSDNEIALVWRKFHKISGEIIIAADYTKFGKRDFIKLGPLDIADKVVTNEKVAEEYKQYFFEKGIPIYTSYPFNA